jgi:hypothetical protein
MEELAIYDCKFVYIKGSDNTVADALSRYPNKHVTTPEKAELTACHPYKTSELQLHSILQLPDPCHSLLTMITALVDSTPHSPPTSTMSTFTISIDNKLLRDI